MLNVIIFLLGAGLMFFMALRSMLARRRLCTRGEKVEATVEGIVQSRDGAAYVLAFATGSTVTLYYDPEDPEKMYVEGDHSVLGAEVLYAVVGAALLVLTVGIAR